MAKVHIDRKALREDAFRNLGFELIDHAFRHRRLYISGATVVVIGVAAVLAYLTYSRYAAARQAAAFHLVEEKISALEETTKDAGAKYRAAVEQFISEYPRGALTPVAWMYLARLAWSEKDLDKAEFALNKVAEQAGSGSTLAIQARIGLAKVAEARGKPEDAAQIYGQLPEGTVADLKAIELGRLALSRNDKAAARRYFEEVANRLPPSVLARWANEELAYSP